MLCGNFQTPVCFLGAFLLLLQIVIGRVASGRSVRFLESLYTSLPTGSLRGEATHNFRRKGLGEGQNPLLQQEEGVCGERAAALLPALVFMHVHIGRSDGYDVYISLVNFATNLGPKTTLKCCKVIAVPYWYEHAVKLQ